MTNLLTEGVRAGHDDPPRVAVRKLAVPLPGAEARWRTRPVRDLLDEAMRRFEGERVQADGWLAPRLHATLRMTRAEAADSGLWNHLAMTIGTDYVVWRHGGTKPVPAARFCGPHYTQAFSRLWWAAELFRNGADYRPVEVACRVQDVLNTTMRLDIVDHRPTALTILEILASQERAGVPRLGDRINALSAAVNAAGSTIVYELLAPEPLRESAALRGWIFDAEEMPAVPWERLPTGPDDGEVGRGAIDALMPLFDRLLAHAPIRSRGRHAAPDEEAVV